MPLAQTILTKQENWQTVKSFKMKKFDKVIDWYNWLMIHALAGMLGYSLAKELFH